MQIKDVGAVSQLGVGKPDYTREVSSAIQRSGLELKFNQRIRALNLLFDAIASPYPWVFPPLAVGATAHMIDLETGLPSPIALLQGYTLAVLTRRALLTQDMYMHTYFDGFLILGDSIQGGSNFYEENVVEISTAMLDPTGASPHLIDVTWTNEGVLTLRGGGTLILLEDKVGSPDLPKTKTVRCKWCGRDYPNMPLTTTMIDCSNPACPGDGHGNKITRFADLSNFKGTMTQHP